ncbi:unnamed protein product [Symbiodinium sp. CCMP2592]|nr:unnamed protein product [Symbiodinium sp. CCMP2592]
MARVGQRSALVRVLCLLLAIRGIGFIAWPTHQKRRPGLQGRPALQDLTVDAVSELKVGRLREELRAAGLDDTGIRSALVQRLVAAVEAAASTVETAEERRQQSPAPFAPGGDLEGPSVRFLVNATVGRMARVVEGSTSDALLVVGDFTGRAAGLDKQSGAVLWTSSTGLDSVSHVAAVGSDPPVVLCASGWTGNVSAFASNVLKWSRDASVGEYARVAQSTPHQLALFAGGGSVTNLVGVDVASGDIRYCVDTGIGAVWSLGASGEPLRVLCGGSWTRPEHTAEVAGFDAMSGEKLFALDPGVGRYIVSTALRDGGTAFVSGENGNVVALDTATGEVKFRSDSMVEEVWSLEVAADLGSGGWSEKVSALDMHTGELRWGPVNATIGKVFSFQLADSLLLCGGADGLLAGIDPGSGDLRFTLDVSIGEIWSLAYDPESRTLFCGGNNESVAAVQL